MKMKRTTALILVGVIASTGIGYACYSQTNPTYAKQDNGFYTLHGKDIGKFDKEKTPVTNMLILMKILNGSSLCSPQWYEEFNSCIEMFEAQLERNKWSKDEEVQHMMKLQLDLVISLRKSLDNMSDEHLDLVKESYHKYHDYYYSLYPKEGN